jgi:hypothetical protein
MQRKDQHLSDRLLGYHVLKKPLPVIELNKRGLRKQAPRSTDVNTSQRTQAER